MANGKCKSPEEGMSKNPGAAKGQAETGMQAGTQGLVRLEGLVLCSECEEELAESFEQDTVGI